MTGRLQSVARTVAALACAGASLLAAPDAPPPAQAGTGRLAPDLDAVFDHPVLARALVGARIQSLGTGDVLYERNAGRHVIPASNMKLVTLAVAAWRLGWDYRYETRLEAAGRIADGTLHGDLVVVGSGDPSIGSLDEGAAPLFSTWVGALRDAGIRRVQGRLVGDDDAFADEGLGAGWSWDYLTAGYAAPSGALSYNENVAVVRARPAAAEGLPAAVIVTPPGSGFEIDNGVVTAAAGSDPTLSVSRTWGARRLTVGGRLPAGGREIIRTTAVEDATRYFVQSLAETLEAHGLQITDGAWDIDELAAPPAAAGRRVIARHQSPTLAVLAGRLMKDSQNFYAETLLKTIGRAATGTGSSQAGRRAVRETIESWGIAPDALVIYDGSGLSRNNYVTADALVTILARMWTDELHRGRFLASLPIGGRDGTLRSRMRDSALAGRIQAKTGTIANVRALSGYLTSDAGDTIVFAIIANHFTAPSARVDEVVEQVLERVASARPPSSSTAAGSTRRSAS